MAALFVCLHIISERMFMLTKVVLSVLVSMPCLSPECLLSRLLALSAYTSVQYLSSECQGFPVLAELLTLRL